MNTRLAFFALVASVGFAFIGQANMYNDWAQKNAVNLNGPSASEAAQSPTAPILQQIKQESQSCQKLQAYVTCAYTRPLDSAIGNMAESIRGDNGIHWQIVIYNGKTGEQIASYGKTTKPIVAGSSFAGYAVGGVVGASVGALEGTAYGQGVVSLDNPVKNPEYAAYRQEPVWCIESNEISLPDIGFYATQVYDSDCKEYVERVKEDLLHNKGGKEIPAPAYAILSTSCKNETGNLIPVLPKGGNTTSIDTPKQDMQSDKTEKSASASELKTVSNQVEVANPTPLAAADSGVGVRGWCKCGAEHGKIYTVGGGGQWISLTTSKLSMIGDYRYELCGRCGMLFKPERAGEAAKIVDLQIEQKYKQFAGSRIPFYEYKSLLKQAENKLLDIPDGKIVIRGTCVCKVPDPVHVGFLENDYSPYVCIICGRVCLPDETGGISNGPTALSEMGLDKQAEEAMKRMCKWIEGL